jgi:hypothetical protein
MRALLPFAVVLPLLVLGCGGTSEVTAADDEPTDDETYELNGRPRYTVHSAAIRGEYRANQGEYCAGGFDACDSIVVRDEDGKLWLQFGEFGESYGTPYWQPEQARTWTENGVVLFTTGELQGDCDDPGCGNMMKITGVIYPVKVGDAWVPRIKAQYTAEFLYPDDEESPSGIVHTTMRLSKQP